MYDKIIYNSVKLDVVESDNYHTVYITTKVRLIKGEVKF